MARSKLRLVFYLCLLGCLYFFWEILSVPTIILLLSVYPLSILLKKPHWGLKQFLILLLLGCYLYIYGVKISPEVGFNFLLSVILLKWHEGHDRRDDLMTFFGLILLLASGFLFEKTIPYFSYATISIFLLLWCLYRTYVGTKVSFKRLFYVLIVSLPLFVLSYFLFPRWLSPILSLQRTPDTVGQVGYSQDLKLSEVDEIKLSSELAFQAQGAKVSEISYWRGHTLSQHDGWNWTITDRERMVLKSLSRDGSSSAPLTLKVRTNGPFPFYIGPDYPLYYQTSQQILAVDVTHLSRAQNPFRSSLTYEVSFSPLLEQAKLRKNERKYFSFIDPALSEQIKSRFGHQKDLQSLLASVRKNIGQGFTYTLRPGKIFSLPEFWQRKMGFCSHYSSALALILRAYNYPSRLVSGFLSGKYNDVGGFYSVSQNDAHVWVEVWDEKSWQRIDPTLWVAPERVLVSGDEFYQKHFSQDLPLSMRFIKSLPPLADLKVKLDQWNALFYSLVENYDRSFQKNWWDNLKISISFGAKYLWGLTTLLLFLIGIYIYLLQKKFTQRQSFELWQKTWKELTQAYPDLEWGQLAKARQRVQSDAGQSWTKILGLWGEYLEGQQNNKRVLRKIDRELYLMTR